MTAVIPPLTPEQEQVSTIGKGGHPEVAAHVIDRTAQTVAGVARMLDPIRAVARQFGYAIAVHGTLARDVDLVAVPWTEEAVDPEILVNAIAHIVRAFYPEWGGSIPPNCPSVKPHGRLAWSIHFDFSTYIDLSVMPRIVVGDGAEGKEP